MTTDDAGLLRLYAEHSDPEAFKELVRRYGDLVFGVCIRVNRNVADAEDVAQECFLELARKAGTIKTSLPGWLHRVAKCKALNFVRSKVSRSHREENAAADEAVSRGEDQLTWAVLGPQVDEAIDALPDELRISLIMYYLEGRKQEEIAERMGVARSTVWANIQRSLEVLRGRLKDTEVSRVAAPALGALLASNGHVTAPDSLVVEATKMAVAGIGSGSSIANAALAARTLSLAKIAGIAVLAVVVAAGAVVIKKKMQSGTRASTPGNPKAGPLLGAPDFYPSADRPVGWRGDGSGRYPGAVNPPVVWDRHLVTPLSAGRCQAKKPADLLKASGTPLKHLNGQYNNSFSVVEWLAIAVQGKEGINIFEQKTMENEGAIEPSAGNKVGDAEWKIVSSNRVDFARLFEKKDNMAGYVFSWIYVPDGLNVGIRTHGQQNWDAYRVWINGTMAAGAGAVNNGLPLSKGWNRLLIKVPSTANTKEWDLTTELFIFEKEATYEQKNIAWLLPTPSWSLSMPIIVGDKLYTTSEPNDLVCIDKKTGKILWIKSAPLYELALQDEKAGVKIDAKVDMAALKAKKAKLEELTAAYVKDPKSINPEERRLLAMELTDMVRRDQRYPQIGEWGGGNTCPTPASDGTNIYVWFGECGMLICFDLDGNRKWISFENPRWGGGHGVNSSPTIVGDKIVLLTPRCEQGIRAFDKKTGKIAWRQESTCWAHPTLVAAKVGKADVVVNTDGTVFSMADGRILSRPMSPNDSMVPSAIVDGDRFFGYNSKAIFGARLPASLDGDASARIIFQATGERLNNVNIYASPLYHDGIVYYVSSEFSTSTRGIYAFDAATGEILYNAPIDYYPATAYSSVGGGVTASITLAGKYIYLMDNAGTTAVLEPGRKFRQVSKNLLQQVVTSTQEVTISTPIFEGNCMYYRGMKNLYCIREK